MRTGVDVTKSYTGDRAHVCAQGLSWVKCGWCNHACTWVTQGPGAIRHFCLRACLHMHGPRTQKCQPYCGWNHSTCHVTCYRVFKRLRTTLKLLISILTINKRPVGPLNISCMIRGVQMEDRSISRWSCSESDLLVLCSVVYIDIIYVIWTNRWHHLTAQKFTVNR